MVWFRRIQALPRSVKPFLLAIVLGFWLKQAEMLGWTRIDDSIGSGYASVALVVFFLVIVGVSLTTVDGTVWVLRRLGLLRTCLGRPAANPLLLGGSLGCGALLVFTGATLMRQDPGVVPRILILSGVGLTMGAGLLGIRDGLRRLWDIARLRLAPVALQTTRAGRA